MCEYLGNQELLVRQKVAGIGAANERMCAFAQDYCCFLGDQNNRKALTPAIGASANFSSTQKVLSDSNKIFYKNNIEEEIILQA